MRTSIFITARDQSGDEAAIHVITEKPWLKIDGSDAVTTFIPAELEKLFVRDEAGNVFEFVPVKLRQSPRLVCSNGAPMFAPDGTMLDEHGNRSIFDDIDE